MAPDAPSIVLTIELGVFAMAGALGAGARVTALVISTVGPPVMRVFFKMGSDAMSRLGSSSVSQIFDASSRARAEAGRRSLFFSRHDMISIDTESGTLSGMGGTAIF
jgi:hypothetical protein